MDLSAALRWTALTAGVCELLERAVTNKQDVYISRALRHVAAVRRSEEAASYIRQFVAHSLIPENETRQSLLATLDKASPPHEPLDADIKRPSKLAQPELEICSRLLLIVYFVDKTEYETAKGICTEAIAYLRKNSAARRTLHSLGARIYFYYSLIFEKIGKLSEIRGELLGLYRSACVQRDDAGQETLLNLILRNYLAYTLYDQAEKFRSKVQLPEHQSNQQFSRYLYYLGRIRAIQLEYTDAKQCLQQALRKAPQRSALVFRITATKWTTLVLLLLGEIPERTMLKQPGMKEALLPYYLVANAVRIGDMPLFQQVTEQYAMVFRKDCTHNLIVRLRHNVIRCKLRRLSLSYSRISLVDVAKRLGGISVEDTEYIVAKAVRDGSIDAVLDHANGCLQSKQTTEIYTTQEPQSAFHTRISFCLNVHNEAVKAMRFPPDALKEQRESAEERRERAREEQEMAKQLADSESDDW